VQASAHGVTPVVRTEIIIVAVHLTSAHALPGLTGILWCTDVSVVTRGAILLRGHDAVPGGRVTFNHLALFQWLLTDNDGFRVYTAVRVLANEGSVAEIAVLLVDAILVRYTDALVFQPHTNAFLTDIVEGAGIHVVAGYGVVRMDASCIRVAGVVSAGIQVVADFVMWFMDAEVLFAVVLCAFDVVFTISWYSDALDPLGVAGVPDSVVVGVGLVRVRVVGAIVHVPAHEVVVKVIVRVVRTPVASVPQPVLVGIYLVFVFREGAVVHVTANPVTVLVVVGVVRTVIEAIRDAVLVRVQRVYYPASADTRLDLVRVFRASVLAVQSSILVRVTVVGSVGAGVANIPVPVSVSIFLVGIRIDRAVVHISADGISVKVVVGVEGTYVVAVGGFVTVGVGVRTHAGVASIADAVPIRIRLGRVR